MSNGSSSTSPHLNAGQEAAPLAWLLALLREAMEGVMVDDTPPLKKANALARLGNLCLKTYDTAELERVNAELVEQVAELAERLTATGVSNAPEEDESAGQPGPANEDSTAASRARKAKRPKHRSHHRPRPAARGVKPGSRRKKARAASG
jgi:hypothetical protein